MGTRSIVAVEMCLHLEPNALAFLHRLVKSGASHISVQEKWNMFNQAIGCLLANKNLWSSGCWDFFDDDTRARSDFNMWVGGMTTLEGARVHPSGAVDPYRGGARYMTFTMAALLVQGSATERQLKYVCDTPEPYLWNGATFEKILQGLRYLNFASVEGTTMYVIPRDPEFALTQEDLRHPKFQYLRPIV